MLCQQAGDNAARAAAKLENLFSLLECRVGDQVI